MNRRRRRILILSIGVGLCLTGALLLLSAPREAAGQIAGIISDSGQVGVQADTGCQFPASGQTTAYTANKKGNPGAVVRDDGTVEAGKTLKYKDNGDGTITDLVTGLMWEKKSSDGGLHDKENTYPWSTSLNHETIWDWLDDVNAEGGTGFARHRDWRIPNARELMSIVNFEKTSPSVSSVFNTNCGNDSTVFTGSCIGEGYYWSSSTVAGNQTNAWMFDFYAVYLTDGWKGDYANYVRAVRGGCGLGPGS